MEPSKPGSNDLAQRPFSELDKEFLSDELRKLSEDLFLKAIIGLGLALFLAIIPKHHRSFVSEYGALKGVLIAISIVGILFLVHYISNKRKYSKDLKGDLKTVQKTTILRKERSFMQMKCFVWLKNGDAPGQRFEVEPEIYDKLQKDQPVYLEYAPNSRFLLHIDWQI
ncbi:MAG: hypothetical protein ACOYPR_22960 [Saprospiraceae bacterium]